MLPEYYGMTCGQCGNEIIRGDKTHYGEEYCIVNDECIHVECMNDWIRENKKEAGEDERS